MSHHLITWTLSHGWTEALATCTAPIGADCRLAGDEGCQCEEWDEIFRDEQDVPYHLAQSGFPDGGDDSTPAARHYMHDMGECNVVNYLNDSDVSELGPSHDVVIGTLPIRPVWDDNGYEWEPAVS